MLWTLYFVNYVLLLTELVAGFLFWPFVVAVAFGRLLLRGLLALLRFVGRLLLLFPYKRNPGRAASSFLAAARPAAALSFFLQEDGLVEMDMVVRSLLRTGIIADSMQFFSPLGWPPLYMSSAALLRVAYSYLMTTSRPGTFELFLKSPPPLCIDSRAKDEIRMHGPDCVAKGCPVGIGRMPELDELQRQL